MRATIFAAAAAALLTVFYALTGLVQSGCEPSYALVLKPAPMWGWSFGGQEGDCRWSIENPHLEAPWWLSPTRVQLTYASMEDTGGGRLSLFYALGLLATAALWIGVLIAGVLNIFRRST